MKNYRFSPIESKQDLLDAIKYLHTASYGLISSVVGKEIPIAGDVGIFCHFEKEFEFLKSLQEQICLSSDNPNQKYFQLKDPITISVPDCPEGVYHWLYIRQPADDSPQVGDIDFVLPDDKYQVLKDQVSKGKFMNASIYDRPGWDMVEINDPGADVLPYICTQEMAEKVRVRF